MIGERLCESVEFVCSDMWQPYLDMVAKHCPNALNILDRFHIVAKMNKAIDEVRADEARRMNRDGYEPVLKKTRWCLLKRQENLTGKQRLRLRELLQYNLRTVRAWLLKEEFQQLWEYVSPVWAERFLDQWCTRVMRSRIEPMKKFARTVRVHRQLILNYFRARGQFSSGIVEGLNNKAKVTMRKAYGFKTFKATEIALYHALGCDTCRRQPRVKRHAVGGKARFCLVTHSLTCRDLLYGQQLPTWTGAAGNCRV